MKPLISTAPTKNLSEIWVRLVFSKSIWPSHDENSNVDSHSKADTWNHHLWSVKTTKISDDIGLWHSPINPHRTPQSNAAISPAPSSSSEHKATGIPKTAQTMMKITLKYWHYEFFIVSNMILVISYISNMILVYLTGIIPIRQNAIQAWYTWKSPLDWSSR